ncbi:hypothetical protein ACFQ3R_08070 [Mesonia ostreae]|uniref:Lipoprotein n=1 Tax=Mesonia ostreae TaxID=861110 RepID=A0ABU2KF96_9FLAO|nr:hypothetical protein [Mesonia ostreae]MDT0293373.1 hypothetical protein [Mesonia ostreae]
MKNIKFILLASLLFSTFTSCFEAFHYIAFPKKPHPKKFQKLSNGKNKEIVIVPMVHLAKPKYYNTSTKIINTLRNDDFTIFYERVTYPKNADSLTLDTLRRKMRKLVGSPFGLKLTDTLHRNVYPNFFSSGRYLQQSAEIAGYSYSLDKNVDLSVVEILDAYKKQFGEIELTECDYKTKFNHRYWCDKLENKSYVVEKLREDFIIKNVLKSNAHKIALVYGKLHYKGLKERLINEGFEKVKY